MCQAVGSSSLFKFHWFELTPCLALQEFVCPNVFADFHGRIGLRCASTCRWATIGTCKCGELRMLFVELTAKLINCYLETPSGSLRSFPRKTPWNIRRSTWNDGNPLIGFVHKSGNVWSLDIFGLLVGYSDTMWQFDSHRTQKALQQTLNVYSPDKHSMYGNVMKCIPPLTPETAPM